MKRIEAKIYLTIGFAFLIYSSIKYFSGHWADYYESLSGAGVLLISLPFVDALLTKIWKIIKEKERG